MDVASDAGLIRLCGQRRGVAKKRHIEVEVLFKAQAMNKVRGEVVGHCSMEDC